MSTQPVLEASLVTKLEATDASRERWIELGLVVLVVIVPLVLNSLAGLLFGLTQVAGAMHDLKHVISICGELAGLALAWYVLRRSKRTFADLGLRWTSNDVLIGIGLALLQLLVTNVASMAHGAAYHF